MNIYTYIFFKIAAVVYILIIENISHVTAIIVFFIFTIFIYFLVLLIFGYIIRESFNRGISEQIQLLYLAYSTVINVCSCM